MHIGAGKIKLYVTEKWDVSLAQGAAYACSDPLFSEAAFFGHVCEMNGGRLNVKVRSVWSYDRGRNKW